jgi:hypothetical protein
MLIPSRNRLTDRDPSHGLCFPTAHAESKVFVRTACRPIAFASAGFGYPLDALLPSTPCRFCFAPAALMGFTLRSVLLAKGIRRFPAGRTHVPLVAAQERPKAILYGLTASVSGRCSFRESLAIKPVFSGLNAGCSLGFRSSRACGQEPGSRFRPNSSYVLCWRKRRLRNRHQSINQPLLGSSESQRQAEANGRTTLVEFLRLYAPEHSIRQTRGLCVHRTSRHALPQNRPTNFASSLRSTGVAQQFT